MKGQPSTESDLDLLIAEMLRRGYTVTDEETETEIIKTLRRPDGAKILIKFCPFCGISLDNLLKRTV